MAEQLNNTDSETVYADFSTASRHLAERRTKFRTNLNIVFVTAWIEALPFHGLGNFDFISSTGVLHHLKCPQICMNVLNNLQSEDGGAIISVYGTYARNGIYQVQELMKLIYHKVPSIKKELNDAKVILSILPKNHWFHTIKITDIIYYGDDRPFAASIVDFF